MNTRAITLLAAASGLSAAAARAQSFTSDSSITMTMSWREATTSGATVPNPDGILEPGEHALILIDSVSFTNQGGLANFSPPIGTFTNGTIIAFGSGLMDLNGSGGTQGAFNITTPLANPAGTSGFGVRGNWRVGSNGTVTPTGVATVEFGQFPIEFPNSENPISNMFRMLWTPADYSPRQVAFSLDPGAVAGDAFAGVMLDLGGLEQVAAEVYVPRSNLTLDSVSIPIAPAPPTLLATAAMAFMPRRRRGCEGRFR